MSFAEPTPTPAELQRDAFEALFRRHHAPLCGFAYRYVRSREVAEEIVQEVFLDVWERWNPNAVERYTKAYLFAAVRNAAMSYLRHLGVVERGETETIELFSRPAITADGELGAAELAAVLERAIGKLPERCRLVLTLSREQGLTYSEIARLLEISVKTVEMQMGRAYKALRKHLAPFWP